MSQHPRLGDCSVWRLFAGPLMAALVLAALVLAVLATGAAAGEMSFHMQQIDDGLQVGYAVRLIDMNGDGKLDIVVVDSKRLVWYENPSWKAHSFLEGKTKADNVCFAPHDIDGDGRLDFALGADWRPSDTVSSGTLQWVSPGKNPGDAWTVHPIAQEPTIHRIGWADFDRDGQPELIVVPLFGRGATRRENFMDHPLRILSYKIPQDPVRDPWKAEVINQDLHVSHNFQVVDLDDDGRLDMLVVSYEGISLLKRDDNGRWSRVLLHEGNQTSEPSKGASEIKLGKLAGGEKYIATIEPWHGNQVVVYRQDPPQVGQPRKWNRHVLDEQLKWGHAVWCANLDDDEDEELIIGVRDNLDESGRCGVRIYDPTPDGWKRMLVDPAGVAVEDLVAGDLDGDGRVDIVAVGRQTHNVRIYWNTTGKE